jgi:hypothetical protein
MTASRVPKGSPWLVRLARGLLVGFSLVLLFFGTTDSGWSLSGYVGWGIYTLWGLLLFYVLTTMSGKDSLGTRQDIESPKEQDGSGAEPAETDREAMRSRVRRHKQERRGSSGRDSVD